MKLQNTMSRPIQYLLPSRSPFSIWQREIRIVCWFCFRLPFPFFGLGLVQANVIVGFPYVAVDRVSREDKAIGIVCPSVSLIVSTLSFESIDL